MNRHNPAPVYILRQQRPGDTNLFCYPVNFIPAILYFSFKIHKANVNNFVLLHKHFSNNFIIPPNSRVFIFKP